MGSDLLKARDAIKNLTKMDFYKEVSVVIYRDHDYPKVIDKFPSEGGFTTRMDQVLLFIDSIDCRARKGVTPNEAALDGLAAAADLNWSN